MKTIARLFGSIFGTVCGLLLLASIRGMLEPLTNPELAISMFGLFALFGVALGVVLTEVEKKRGHLNLIQSVLGGWALLLAVCLLAFLGVVIFQALNGIESTGSSIPGWRDLKYVLLATSNIGCSGGVGFYLASRLAPRE